MNKFIASDERVLWHLALEMVTRDHVTIIIIIKPTYHPAWMAFWPEQHKIKLLWPNSTLNFGHLGCDKIGGNTHVSCYVL